jgi:hypothetical protein
MLNLWLKANFILALGKATPYPKVKTQGFYIRDDITVSLVTH